MLEECQLTVSVPAEPGELYGNFGRHMIVLLLVATQYVGRLLYYSLLRPLGKIVSTCPVLIKLILRGGGGQC